MKYKLKVKTILEYGQRVDADGNPHQEDSIYPAHGHQRDTDRLFILCDGMGGHDAGEVASATVCKVMSTSVLKNTSDAEGFFSDDILQQAIDDAFNALDAVDTNVSSEKKMGTTMTFLKFHKDGCTIAHMGDSRVYHIRPGKGRDDSKILFKTSDHSLVNDLIKVGELTPEEAKFSKQKNVITRAMQPNMGRRPKADIYHTDDIRPGDYFYMCSDGMLEQMEDENILFNFSEATGNDDNKVKILTQATSQNSDNHSAIIIHILDVFDIKASEKSDKNTATKKPTPIMAEVEEDNSTLKPQSSSESETTTSKETHNSHSLAKRVIKYLFGILIVLTIVFFGIRYGGTYVLRELTTDSVYVDNQSDSMNIESNDKATDTIKKETPIINSLFNNNSQQADKIQNTTEEVNKPDNTPIKKKADEAEVKDKDEKNEKDEKASQTNKTDNVEKVEKTDTVSNK